MNKNVDIGEKGLEKWLGEAMEMWNTSSLMGKLMMVFACIGASTTLTSLSGVILEWKGLIAEMIQFYGQYVRDPIAFILRFITIGFLRPTGPVIDAILLYLLYFSAEKRVIGKLSNRSALNASTFIMGVILLPLIMLFFILLILFVIDYYSIFKIWIYADNITLGYFLVLILMAIVGSISNLKMLSRGEGMDYISPECRPLFYKSEIRKFINFILPIIVAVFTLIVLTSINIAW